MTDEDEFLRYDRMVEAALRGVVRTSIEEVIRYEKRGIATGRHDPEGRTGMGLPGDHHFYITFLTDYPGVKIPKYLRDRYPGEMTIVLQYQFSDLSVDEDDTMYVTLSFNNVPERLEIPLSSISIFADPSVNFALQFQPLGDAMEEADLAALAELEDGPDDDGSSGGKGKGGKKTGEVVSLDKFRKK